MKKMVKVLIYSLAVFIGIFGMGQLNVLADDSTENVNDETDAQLAEPHKWGDNATWWIKDSVLYLDGTSLQPTYSAHNGVVARKIMDTPWNQDPDDYLKPTISSKITKVVINPDTKSNLVLPTDSSALFRSLSSVTEFVGLNKLDISNVTDFSYMFSDETSLRNLDLSSFKTSKKVNLTEMFMLGAKNIDLSGFTNPEDIVTNIFEKESSYPAYVEKIKLGGINLADSGTTGNWVRMDSDDKTPVNFDGAKIDSGTWRRLVSKDDKNSDMTILNVCSNKPLNFAEEGVTATLEENVNEEIKNIPTVSIDDTAYLYSVTVSKSANKAPEFYGDLVNIKAPVIKGYTSNSDSFKIIYDGEFSQINNIDKKVTLKNEETGQTESFSYTIYYTKDKPAVKPTTPSTHHTSTSTTTPTIPTVTSKYTHKLQVLTTYPDQDSANIYDEEGNLSKTVALSPDSNWQTDEYMTIKGEKYYRVATNEFVKASDIYLYTSKYSVVRTHDGADYISLDNSHVDTVTNRALAIKTDWKIDKVIKINNEDYYRVATNEFVKADNVDVIR